MLHAGAPKKMKSITAIAAVLALAIGFGLGRLTVSHPESASEPPGVDSFRRGLADPDWMTRSYRTSGFLRNLGPEQLPEALAVVEDRLPWLLTD